MDQHSVPAGFSTLSPYLVAAGAQKVIDFATAVFGATPMRRFEQPDGSVMHAEFRVGDTVVMVGDANDNWPAIPAHLHVYVSDVDATYARALEHGATSVQEPKKNDGDPDRRAGVKDAAGLTWWIATRVE